MNLAHFLLTYLINKGLYSFIYIYIMYLDSYLSNCGKLNYKKMKD